MKKSEAAKYARWSAAAAALCAAVTLAVYLKRGYTRHVETKNAPPSPAVNVERQSTGLTFSKGEGTHTVFTVEASKSTEFKGRNATDLEGVKVTIFGKEGTRHDTLETHACRYSKDTSDFDCAGDVQITLMSKEDWEAAAARLAGGRGNSQSHAMHVETRGMTFNRASGTAKTDQQVRFTFTGGSGQALGAAYRSDEGTLHLLRSVRLKLDQPAPASIKTVTPQKTREPVEVIGSRMEINRDAGTMYLAGPAEAKTHSERLIAAAFLLELDAAFRAKRLTALSDGKNLLPEFTAQKGAGRRRLSADEIVAEFAPQGWITRAQAKRQVRGEAAKGDDQQTVIAQSAALDMVPRLNSPKLAVLRGGVDARTAERRLTTEQLRLAFAATPGAKGGQLQNAETIGPGRLEWTDAAGANTQAAQTALQANQLQVRFDVAGKASRLDALDSVQTERTLAGAKQTATANRGFVELQPGGGWSRIQLNENVLLNEPQRAARADQATFTRNDQTVILTGHATVKDASSQTSAQKLTFWQATGDVRGEGNVRSSDLSARSGAVHLAPVASNISADNLAANSKSGRALYTGHARLWQGDSVLEAESIELLKGEKVLNASGNVRAVFPQLARSASAANTQNSSFSPSGPVTSAQTPVLWHAQSAKLTYWDAENRARLEQKVMVQSPEQKMSGDLLDLYFTRGGSPSGASALQGAQQISRAVGAGSVLVQQGGRRATAERGEYTEADGRFVMSGGTPTLFDADQGTTTGRQLTFFLADDTIIVDSENGSRTLTKHRVEK